MKTLVERLLEYRPHDEFGPTQHAICNEAATEIDRLTRELAAERESVADLAAETQRLTDAMIASRLDASAAREELSEARPKALAEAAQIIRARMPLYTEPQARNACREGAASIEFASKGRDR